MNHNTLNLQVGQTVIMDGKHEVTITDFTQPSSLYATVYSGDASDTWQVMTCRLQPTPPTVNKKEVGDE